MESKKITRFRTNTVLINTLHTDFEKTMKFNGEKWFFGSRQLLSFSSFLKPLLDIKLGNIPEHILSETAVEGQDIMKWLEHLHKTKDVKMSDYDFVSERSRLMFYSLIDLLKERNIIIKDVEKHVHNGYWHGYIDMIGYDRERNRYALIEIKTRSNHEIRNTDILQLLTYSSIVGDAYCTKYLITINRKDFSAKLHIINKNTFPIQHLRKCVNDYLNVLEMDKNYEI